MPGTATPLILSTFSAFEIASFFFVQALRRDRSNAVVISAVRFFTFMFIIRLVCRFRIRSRLGQPLRGCPVNYLASLMAGGFQVPSMRDGGVSFGQ